VLRPARPLFLGRKSCLPARPLLERPPFTTEGLWAALKTLPFDGAADVELSDLSDEPEGRRVREVADLRDWRSGLHAGARRVRELGPGDDW
jgi:CRISPR system Cascade subunit CasD